MSRTIRLDLTIIKCLRINGLCAIIQAKRPTRATSSLPTINKTTSTRGDTMAGSGPKTTTELAQIIDRNIAALLDRRQKEDDRKSVEHRIADVITRFTGNMIFVYIHLVVFSLWIMINLGWLSGLGLPRFDPTLVILAMVASVEAIFLSTFILISQNRMMALADKRADL